MLEMIPSDFNVALVFQDHGTALFAGRRPDIWHFVLATKENVAGNYQSINISQFHWPRFSVARALASPSGGASPALVQRLGIRSEGDATVVELRGSVYRLPGSLVSDMQKDLPLLARANAAVRGTRQGYEVTGAVSSRGYPVVASQRSLAEAIAFEREARRKLDPRDFAVYSAFCTWRDFIVDDPAKKESIARGMAEEMVSWDAETIGDDEYWKSVFAIQDRLWGSRIWGPNIDAEESILLDAFSRAFERLSSIQFAQFVLMNGMHEGGPFHALATLFGLSDFDGYKYWRTREFQPDSEGEQEIRTHSSFIELLGISDPERRA